MQGTVILLLRAVHILVGSLWVGVAVFNAVYLIPSVMAAGPAGGQVMRVLVQQRRLPLFMNWVMALTLLSGTGLMYWAAGELGSEWYQSNAGIAFSTGAVLAFVTAGIAQVVTVPTVRKLGQLGAAIAADLVANPESNREMGLLQRRLLAAAQVGAMLVVAATVLMGVARYL